MGAREGLVRAPSTRRRLRSLAVGGVLCAGLSLGGCGEATWVLDPPGPRAARVADLWWLMFGLGTAVFLGVMALLFYAVVARRQPGTTSPVGGTGLIAVGGVALPAVILAALLALATCTTAALAEPPGPATLTIEVTGYQFWWEVSYPDQRVVTANEIHIPVDQPVRLRLTSGDVVHSLWAPQLAGKVDLIPGRTTTLWLEADEPGVYFGACAEYCGLQHAKMLFRVVAQPPEEFAAWVQLQQQPAAAPAEPLLQRGQRVFFAAGCATCHAIRGTPAEGRLGPDLTHLAVRRTLAAGVLENNRGNLAGWIVQPQRIKEGNKMPPTNLASEDLLALVHYLESLK